MKHGQIKGKGGFLINTKTQIIVVCTLAILLLSITAVSASDEGGNLQATVDDDIIDVSENEMLFMGIDYNTDNVLGDDDNQNGTIIELTNLIKTTDDVLILEKDYVYDETIDPSSGLIINKNNYIIDFNGHLLDANNKNGTILTINGKNVTIKNMKFIAANSTYSDPTINWIGDYGILDNVIFSCNNYNYTIFWTGDYGLMNNIYGENCPFKFLETKGNYFKLLTSNFKNIGIRGNSNPPSAFAFLFGGDNAEINNCTFENVNMTICLQGENSIVQNCNFTSLIWGYYGGGVNNKLSRCNFYSCVGWNQVRGIFYFSINPGTVEYCNLINCSSHDVNSQTLIFCDNGASSVHDLTFIGCKAKCIFYDTTREIYNCTFENNTLAQMFFSTLQSGDSPIHDIYNCTFKNNTVGSTLIPVSRGTYVIEKTDFFNNTASSGVIYMTGGKTRLIDCNFDTRDEFDGWAVSALDNMYMYFENTNYYSETTAKPVNTNKYNTERILKLYVSPNGNGNGLTVTTPTNITDAVNRIDTNGEIIFLKDTYNFKDITIPTACIINGNGATVNNGYSGYVFQVSSENVVIKNFTIEKSGSESVVAPLCFYSGYNLKVMDCTFNENKGMQSGGIGQSKYNNDPYGTGCFIMTIDGCTFKNNQGTCSTNWYGYQTTPFSAGAIAVMTSTKILNCLFEGNSAHHTGAIVFIRSSAANTIYNCTFKDNRATNATVTNPINSAGAISGISNTNSFNIDNCTFENNAAQFYGGAITILKGKVSNSTFNNNQASDFGGAVYWNCEKGEIFNCTFINNKQTNLSDSYGGGAIYINQGDVNINDCRFESNQAQYGSAIHTNSSITNTISISISDFKNNIGNVVELGNYSAEISLSNFTGNSGCGIKVEGNESTQFLNILNCIFTNNQGGSLSGAIWSNALTSIVNSNFTNNNGNAGGAVYLSFSHSDVLNSNFTNNVAPAGGALYLVGENIEVDNCIFKGNNATSTSTSKGGGSIYVNQHYLIVTESSFTNNHAKSYGGAIYIGGTETDKLYYYVDDFTRSTFLGTNKADGNSLYNDIYDGTAQSLKTCVYVVLDPINFIVGGHTSDLSGVDRDNPTYFERGLDIIAPGGTITFINASEIFNKYTYGEKVNQAYNGDIIECNKNGVKFYGNNTTFVNLRFVIIEDTPNVEFYNMNFKGCSNSVIIFNSTSCIVDNCTFKDNLGSDCVKGAAIQVLGDNITIKNSNFVNNEVSADVDVVGGGAVYCNSNNLTVFNCTFDSNSANIGAHILLDGDSEKITINQSRFNNALKVSSGGYGVVVKCSEVDILGCNFTNNNASGALHLMSAVFKVNIIGNNFTNNKAIYGGAISFVDNPNGECINNTFEGNDATYGGALYFNGGSFIIQGNNFTRNTASYGGAIYLNNTEVTLDNLIFNSNHANEGSTIYLNKGNTLSLNDCTFESNTASGEGTIYLGSSVSLNQNGLTFSNNEKASTDIYFASGYIASELYVNENGGGTGTTSADPTTLSNALEHISENGKIIFTEDICLNTIVAITNKNIALVGNGWTITRSGSGRAFTITGSTVNIENLTFNNFGTSDCVVYYDSASSGSVVNTNFANQASGTSALDIEGNVDVTNCLFEGNTVTVGALYYGSSASGTVSGSTFDNPNSLYLDSDVTVSGNTFICPTVTIDEITATQPYHSTVTISGTFDDGTNRPHTINITCNGESINVASLTASKTFSYSYVNLTNGDYVISMNVVDDGNTYTYTAPTRSFTVSPANTIYIGPSATGDGSGVDINNLATWDTIGTRLATNGVVYFTDGEYSLNQKTISNPWTLTASSASNVVINGGSSTIFTVNSDGVTIENLTLTSSTRPILGTSTVTVKNSVLYNQLTIDSFSDPVYGDTITISGSIGNIDIASLEAYSGDELIGSTTISGSATTYTITRNGNLAVGSYTLSVTKKQEKRRIL